MFICKIFSPIQSAPVLLNNDGMDYKSFYIPDWGGLYIEQSNTNSTKQGKLTKYNISVWSTYNIL